VNHTLSLAEDAFSLGNNKVWRAEMQGDFHYSGGREIGLAAAEWRVERAGFRCDLPSRLALTSISSRQTKKIGRVSKKKKSCGDLPLKISLRSCISLRRSITSEGLFTRQLTLMMFPFTFSRETINLTSSSKASSRSQGSQGLRVSQRRGRYRPERARPPPPKRASEGEGRKTGASLSSPPSSCRPRQSTTARPPNEEEEEEDLPLAVAVPERGRSHFVRLLRLTRLLLADEIASKVGEGQKWTERERVWPDQHFPFIAEEGRRHLILSRGTSWRDAERVILIAALTFRYALRQGQ